MKRFILLFIFLLFISGLSLYAAGIREMYETPAKHGSSVWKITKDGNTMYLAGSVHILRETDFPLPYEFIYAFSKSEILVLEADTEQLTEPDVIQYLISQIFLPDELTLQDILEEEIFELLSAAYSEYGLSINEAVRMKPSMAVNILVLTQMQEYGFVEEGVDDYFYQKALEENKQVLFLESVQVQIDMLVSLGEGYEDEYVLYSLQNMDTTGEELEMLLVEWRNGIRDSSDETLIDMKEEWPESYKALITNRHDEWMPQIEEFLKSEKTHFVIAGLLHMYGPDGLLKFLEDLGCDIEQIILPY